jgi:hypothetical protein
MWEAGALLGMDGSLYQGVLREAFKILWIKMVCYI